MTQAEPAKQSKRVRLTGEQRERQLLDVAEKLFTERGYEAVSIEDIARAAGVSRPIVYHHYGSREGVFLACVARARREFERSLLDRVSAAGEDLTEVFRAGGEAYFDLIEDDPQRFVLLFTASSSLHAELSDQLGTLRADTIRTIATVIRQKDPSVESEVALAIAYSASGIGEQLGRWWLDEPSIPKRKLLSYYTGALNGAMKGILAVANVADRSGG